MGLIVGRLFFLALVLGGVMRSARAEAEILILDLQQGLALARENNESLLQARLDKVSSREAVRQARAAGLPQLDASINYNRNWLLPSFVFAGNAVKIGTENNLSGNLNVRQRLYAGGGIRATVDMARHQLAITGETERETQQLVVAAVEERFYDLLLSRELLKVSHLAIERARRNLTQVAARERAGRASEFDRLRAQVQVSSMRADSIRAENAMRLAVMTFKDIVGLDLDQPIEVRGTFRSESSLDLADLEALLIKGVARRPDLERVDHQVGLQQRGIAAERSANRPSLDFVATGQTQFQSDKLDVADREWRKSWNTGLVLQIPIFDGQLTGARVAQARQGVRRAEYDRQRLARAVRLQIQQAFYDVQEASERIAANRNAVRQAEKGLQIAESRYASGVGTQLEMLDAQLALVQSQTENSTARRDRALALMRLERAVGVLGE
jgi:outer membrane protein TolC